MWFTSFINICTRLPKGCNHLCLNHLFINGNENVMSKINAGVILTEISDHITICVSISNNVDLGNK